MTRTAAIFLLALAGCPERPQIPVEGGAIVPTLTLESDAPTASLRFEVESTAPTQDIEPEVRGAVASLDCDMTAFLGVCDDCTPRVRGVLKTGDTVVDEVSVSIDVGRTADLGLEDWDTLAACPEGEACAATWTVELSLEDDGYVQLDCGAHATVWVHERSDGQPPAGAEITVTAEVE